MGDWRIEHQRKLDAYREQTRRTMQAFSDKALAFQSSIIIGGIDREECDREIAARAERRVWDAKLRMGFSGWRTFT